MVVQLGSEGWESLPECSQPMSKLIRHLHPSRAPNVNFISDIGDTLISNGLTHESKAINLRANFKNHPLPPPSPR